MDEVKRLFKPEFLNRIDDIIVFHKLSREDIKIICAKMLETVNNRMESLGIKMSIDEAAINLLAEQGFDPIYGARPLRRTIQNAIEDTAAEKMLEGSIKTGETVIITVKDGVLDFASSK
jgi:ATP-dependent Clp protease ATP-binding subunit ClpC